MSSILGLLIFHCCVVCLLYCLWLCCLHLCVQNPWYYQVVCTHVISIIGFWVVCAHEFSILSATESFALTCSVSFACLLSLVVLLALTCSVSLVCHRVVCTHVFSLLIVAQDGCVVCAHVLSTLMFSLSLAQYFWTTVYALVGCCVLFMQVCALHPWLCLQGSKTLNILPKNDQILAIFHPICIKLL